MTASAGLLRGRVLRTVGGVYQVEPEGAGGAGATGGATLECALRGRTKRVRGLGRVAVGDLVEVERLADGSCAIVGVLPRSARLSRRSSSGRREQIIATNVDRLAAVFSVTQPEPLFRLLDRFLVLAESNEIAAFVVVNKVDLTGAAAAGERFRIYEAAGYDVVYTSVKTGTNIESLRDHLRGHLTLFVGPSGVGKSSLLNALQPGLGLRIGELSRALGRGRHTTVTASLHPLDGGGYVVDTPGLGQLTFWEVEHRELDACFPEFRPYRDGCKFDDCGHEHEPDCRVKGAVEAGEIAPSRYQSYLAIREERQAAG